MAAKSMQCLDVHATTQQPPLSARKVPMKVLCLGYSRTGTRGKRSKAYLIVMWLKRPHLQAHPSPALRDALLTLGFHHTYHTFDAAFVNPHDCKLWLDALRAKCDGVGKKPGREEFDRLLGHCQVGGFLPRYGLPYACGFPLTDTYCQAVTDLPAAHFAQELISAYPEAKVILTVRDVDEWHKSVENTLQVVDNSLFLAVLGFTAKVLFMPYRWNRPMFQKLHQALYDGDFERNGRRSFQQHYDLVRSLVPPGKLLEYHVSDGWEPLCKFLDKPIPSEDIPFINQTAGFKERFRRRTMANLMAQVKRTLSVSAYAVLAVSVAVSVAAALMARLSPFK
ncbi:hypothetical protein TOPH_06420 [Tolypocladium ophioglossoides CBS 100239]|uniref:NAD dependent epimerase/dehydratase n=1 Tax=Tolypocladium ophioglossoides (strain CBS 100239) TaxID=1163406 RepID=A0A0L0N4X5_TOLOC|nr:hypothetical protein TOPH_06420 [Tolypocladium ophioglossoides CBS 100239]